MLGAFCVSTFGGTPQGIAEPHPLVPPLASCNYCPCPSRTATCIGLPCIPVCDPAEIGQAAGPPWNLTLQEAINTALANSEAVRNLGLVEAGSRNDIVRSVITSYDPLEADALAAAEWGIFDPLWTTEMVWDKFDIPPGTSFSGIGNRPPQLDTADFYTSLEQLLPIGTRVRADLVTNYLFNPDKPPGLNPNPQYFSYNQIGLTQPLWRGLGVDVTMAPIRIACAQAERTDWQFKQEILALVRSIETTYWGLYAQQQNLKAIEQAIPYFREVVRLRQEQVGSEVGVESEVARAQSEAFLFEQRRLETLSRIAEQQLVLRNLMGLPPNDCRDILLLAVPVTTRPFETLQCAVQTAVNSRPDVLRQRLAVYVASQERLLADNVLKPQLDFNGYWRTNGLGEDLEQSYEVKDGNKFNDWHMGVFFQVPLGQRQGRNGLRAAEYRVSRERALLEQTAHQASYEVADAYRRINWVYQQLQVASSRQQSLATYSQAARAQFDSPPPGMSTIFALELYLQNLRDITDASISASALLADYNSALARLEEVKGTLLENRMVEVAGDVSDTLPSQLPVPEMQLPGSVQPTPAAPLADPAPQAAPQGAGVLPPAAEPEEIARQPLPQPLPLPSIGQPESIASGPDAYAELPIALTPLPSPTPMPAPEPQQLAAPVIEAPMELSQVAPTPNVAPMPKIEMPESTLPESTIPEPSYTAMRSAPAEAPVAESPMIENPAALESSARMRPQYAPARRELSLLMPRSIMPEPAPTAAPRLANSEPSPVAQAEPMPHPVRTSQNPPPPSNPSKPQATLQMPDSVALARQAVETRKLPQPMLRRLPTASLQMPRSIQSMGPESTADSTPSKPQDGTRQATRKMHAPPATRQSAPSRQDGPQLLMPDSVRPAAAQAPLAQVK